MKESIADYVACVRAQGAQLGGERQQQISAAVGTAGVHAGGAAEVKESLEKRYAASDAAMLAIIQRCGEASSSELAATGKAPPAKAPPATCPAFAGTWIRTPDMVPFAITSGDDCEMTVEIPGTGFIHTMRARPTGNDLRGIMTRRNRANGCTVNMHVHLALVDGRIRESVEGVDGQCDIGPSHRETFWLDRQK